MHYQWVGVWKNNLLLYILGYSFVNLFWRPSSHFVIHPIPLIVSICICLLPFPASDSMYSCHKVDFFVSPLSCFPGSRPLVNMVECVFCLPISTATSSVLRPPSSRPVVDSISFLILQPTHMPPNPRQTSMLYVVLVKQMLQQQQHCNEQQQHQPWQTYSKNNNKKQSTEHRTKQTRLNWNCIRKQG